MQYWIWFVTRHVSLSWKNPRFNERNNKKLRRDSLRTTYPPQKKCYPGWCHQKDFSHWMMQARQLLSSFLPISSAHDSLANVVGSIVDLAKVSSPDQFSFILSLTICTLIQLKLPPELCAPGEMRFEKERLTPEETFEEECLNIVLPCPKHPKLSKIPNKHPTHCLAAATHLLQKRMFNTKVSQATMLVNLG